MADVYEYCRRRAWQLRLRPGDSQWLIDVAASYLPSDPRSNVRQQQAAWKRLLKTKLDASVRARYGNPLVVWLLVHIVVPVVVRLVIQWWLERQEAGRGRRV